MPSSLGDLTSDTSALAALINATRQPGGISQYLSNQYAALSRLPADVQQMNQQIAAVSAVIAGSHGDTSSLDAARSELATITAQQPLAIYQVQQLISAIGPILPQLSSGQFDFNVLSTLSGSGINIVSAFDNINSLLAMRDDAQQKIRDAALNPALPPQVQQDAANALTGATTSTLIKYGLMAAGVLIGVKVLKAVF